jgi:hypothetical protein
MRRIAMLAMVAAIGMASTGCRAPLRYTRPNTT